MASQCEDKCKLQIKEAVDNERASLADAVRKQVSVLFLLVVIDTNHFSTYNPTCCINVIIIVIIIMIFCFE